MKNKPSHAESIAIAMIIAGLAIAFAPSLLETGWNIQDNTASSFGGVVIIMAFVQLAFFYKEKFKLEKNTESMAAGTVLLAASILLLAIGPSVLGTGFWLDRYDLLALPIFLLGGITLFFGFDSLKRLWFLALYSFAAWPVISRPLSSIEPLIAKTTASIVYYISTGLLGLQVQLSEASFTHAGCSMDIVVAPECVAISAVAGLLAFVVPMAYFMKGSAKNKLAWLACGILLIEVLNVLRITTVINMWYYEGIDNALELFHATGGVMLFNASVLAMLISYPLFKLGLPDLRGIALFSGVSKTLVKAREDMKKNRALLAAPAIMLVIATAAALPTDYNAVHAYSWITPANPEDAQPIHAAAASLPFDSSWQQLGYETYYGEGVIATKFVFEQPSEDQVQVIVYSSSNQSTLEFNAEEVLAQDNYTMASEKQASINGLRGTILEYEGGGAHFTTVYWTQTYYQDGVPSFLAIGFTKGNYAGESSEEELLAIAQEFESRMNP